MDMEIASNTTPYVTQEAVAMKLAGDAKKILSRFAIEENPCACCEDTPATQVISIGRETDCDKDNCDTCSAGNPALEIASAANTKAPLIAEENRACSSGCQSGCEEIYVVENVMTSEMLPNSELAHMVGIEVVDSESVKLAERMARIEARLMRIETLLNQLASQL
ncbi:MAG: hypothetical protein MK209_09335 [Planctomycetes bacterium]|nr:hypothetical protein [Planctomycetota bacterium]